MIRFRPLLLAGCLGVALAVGCGPPSTAQDVDPSEVAAWLEGGAAALLLDVRSEPEYAEGHIPGALNIPHDELGARLGELDPDRAAPIVVYCERGGRAARAEGLLRAAGYTSVRHLRGDMAAWRRDGRPVE